MNFTFLGDFLGHLKKIRNAVYSSLFCQSILFTGFPSWPRHGFPNLQKLRFNTPKFILVHAPTKWAEIQNVSTFGLQMLSNQERLGRPLRRHWKYLRVDFVVFVRMNWNWECKHILTKIIQFSSQKGLQRASRSHWQSSESDFLNVVQMKNYVQAWWPQTFRWAIKLIYVWNKWTVLKNALNAHLCVFMTCFPSISIHFPVLQLMK